MLLGILSRQFFQRMNEFFDKRKTATKEGRIPYGLIILLHVEVMIVVFKLISRQMVTLETEELWLSLLNLNLI